MLRLILPAFACASKVLKMTCFPRDVSYTWGVLCPISAILAYLHLREPSSGPLFIDTHGRPLTRSRLSSFIQSVLQGAGIPGKFSSHSFRIGTATAAAQCGIPDHLIKTMGRWTSDAYQLYVSTPVISIWKFRGGCFSNRYLIKGDIGFGRYGLGRLQATSPFSEP